MIDSTLIAYLLLYLTFQFFTDKKWLKAHQKAMSVLAMLFLVYTMINICQQWYSGYLYEYIAFQRRALGLQAGYLWFSIIQVIIFIIPIVNFKSKNRSKRWLQWMINGLIIIYLIVRYILNDFSTSVIPGWHTTIYPRLDIHSILIGIGLFLIMDFLQIKRFTQRQID